MAVADVGGGRDHRRRAAFLLVVWSSVCFSLPLRPRTALKRLALARCGGFNVRWWWLDVSCVPARGKAVRSGLDL